MKDLLIGPEPEALPLDAGPGKIIYQPQDKCDSYLYHTLLLLLNAAAGIRQILQPLHGGSF